MKKVSKKEYDYITIVLLILITLLGIKYILHSSADLGAGCNTCNLYNDNLDTFVNGQCIFLGHYLNIKCDNNISLSEKNINHYEYSDLHKNDLLFVIDMQYDFYDPNGAFYVKEGENTIDPIIELINQWKGSIITSIDYHPPGHCSFFDTRFAQCSGPYPPHCIWRSEGAKLDKGIVNTLKNKKSSKIIYKGFMNTFDSYGATHYGLAGCGRIFNKCSNFSNHEVSSKMEIMTGGYLLGNQNDASKEKYPTINEMTSYQIDIQKGNNNNYLSVTDYLNNDLQDIQRIFVVGLAGDFCVLDTVKNLIEFYIGQHIEIYLVLNHTRFAWLPEEFIPNGDSRLSFNGGYFLTPPENIANIGRNHFCTIGDDCEINQPIK